MISTKVKIFAILLLIAISINQSGQKSVRRNPQKRFNARNIGKIFRVMGRKIKDVGRGIRKGFHKLDFSKIKDFGRGIGNAFKKINLSKLKVMGKVLGGIGSAALVGIPILDLIMAKKEMEGKQQNKLDHTEIKNEAFDAQLVRLHNNLRTEAGIKINLKWDKKLEGEATDWAKECREDFKAFGDSRDELYSQNIYKADDSEADPQSALALWLSKFNYDENRKCKTDSDCDYILKAANPASKFIGCARSACPNGNDFRSIMVCFYTPA